MAESSVTNSNRSQQTVNHYTLLVIGGIVLALAGFAAGRAFPVHMYQQIGTSSYLFDIHTGKLCAPFRNSEMAEAAAKKAVLQPESPMADAWQKRWDELHPKTAADMIPACGSE